MLPRTGRCRLKAEKHRYGNQGRATRLVYLEAPCRVFVATATTNLLSPMKKGPRQDTSVNYVMTRFSVGICVVYCRNKGF